MNWKTKRIFTSMGAIQFHIIIMSPIGIHSGDLMATPITAIIDGAIAPHSCLVTATIPFIATSTLVIPHAGDIIVILTFTLIMAEYPFTIRAIVIIIIMGKNLKDVNLTDARRKDAAGIVRAPSLFLSHLHVMA